MLASVAEKKKIQPEASAQPAGIPPARGPWLTWWLHYLPGLDLLLRYETAWWKKDLAAGVSVAAIALPVGIAYADLAGVPAVVGMYSAIFPLFAYAFFGSSRQLMTGPDAATCMIVAASLGALAAGDSEKYLAMLVVLTVLTGFVYLIGGFMRLGFIANFLSQPILTGYLNGIALLIIASQLPKLFGVPAESSDFFPGLMGFIQELPETHWTTLILGLALLAVLLVLRWRVRRWPAPLIVVILGIVAVAWMGLEQQGVTVLGHVPAGLPTFRWQVFEWDTYEALVRDALGIGLVSFTSGILTAKSFARRNRYELNADQELTAYGACNLFTGLLQGYPVTGADSRTAVNDAMGGKTQVTGLVAGATMLLVLFFLTEPLADVPITALAAVIIVAAFGLFDVRAWERMLRISPVEFSLSVGTTLGVLIVGVLPGVLLAVGISILLLLAGASKPHTAVVGRVKQLKSFHSVQDYPEAKTLPGLLLFRFDGSIVFFNADYFKDELKHAIHAQKDPVRWAVVDASPISLVDLTAVTKLDELREELAEEGITFCLSGLRREPSKLFRRAGVFERLGPHQLFPGLKVAMRSYEHQCQAESSLKSQKEVG